MKHLLILLLLAVLLDLAIPLPRKSKAEKEKEKTKHKSGSKKTHQPKPEEGHAQKGIKKQMLAGMPAYGGEEPVEGIGAGGFGGGGLGGEIEGMPTGMGAGGEPLGFGGAGASPFGQAAAGIPGIANPQAEDGRLEDGPRGTPVGLTGLAPGIGAQNAEFNPADEGSPINALPSGNLVSPIINGPADDGIQQPVPAVSNNDLQDNQLISNAEQGDPGQDVASEAASFSKAGLSDNGDADSTPSQVRDVEATSMNGAQVMMGVQGGMKRHNLKKGKKARKSGKSKKHV